MTKNLRIALASICFVLVLFCLVLSFSILLNGHWFTGIVLLLLLGAAVYLAVMFLTANKRRERKASQYATSRTVNGVSTLAANEPQNAWGDFAGSVQTSEGSRPVVLRRTVNEYKDELEMVDASDADVPYPDGFQSEQYRKAREYFKNADDNARRLITEYSDLLDKNSDEPDDLRNFYDSLDDDDRAILNDFADCYYYDEAVMAEEQQKDQEAASDTDDLENPRQITRTPHRRQFNTWSGELDVPTPKRRGTWPTWGIGTENDKIVIIDGLTYIVNTVSGIGIEVTPDTNEPVTRTAEDEDGTAYYVYVGIQIAK